MLNGDKTKLKKHEYTSLGIPIESTLKLFCARSLNRLITVDPPSGSNDTSSGSISNSVIFLHCWNINLLYHDFYKFCHILMVPFGNRGV